MAWPGLQLGTCCPPQHHSLALLLPWASALLPAQHWILAQCPFLVAKAFYLPLNNVLYTLKYMAYMAPGDLTLTMGPNVVLGLGSGLYIIYMPLGHGHL